jgi:4-carboxymuconolactone decarboxylase
MGRPPQQDCVPRPLTPPESPGTIRGHEPFERSLHARHRRPHPAQRAIGDFAPKLVSLTDDVLFGDVWERTELSKRDRSLITVAALIAGGNTEQLKNHLARAKDNGLTETELKEVIIHLAFYAGWPRAMSAITVAKDVFGS